MVLSLSDPVLCGQVNGRPARAHDWFDTESCARPRFLYWKLIGKDIKSLA